MLFRGFINRSVLRVNRLRETFIRQIVQFRAAEGRWNIGVGSLATERPFLSSCQGRKRIGLSRMIAEKYTRTHVHIHVYIYIRTCTQVMETKARTDGRRKDCEKKGKRGEHTRGKGRGEGRSVRIPWNRIKKPAYRRNYITVTILPSQKELFAAVNKKAG